MKHTKSIIRTDSSHKGFVDLVHQLDQYLAVLDGSEHDFYHQFNNIDVLNNVVVITLNGEEVACGAFKEWKPGMIEIKRMFTDPKVRGQGLATQVLNELEKWAQELGFTCVLLETGVKMPDAIALYKKLGYLQIPNYGQYEGKSLSCCFEKKLL